MIAKLKENRKAIILLIMLLIVISIGISYAYWRYAVMQTKENNLTSIIIPKAYTIVDRILNLIFVSILFACRFGCFILFNFDFLIVILFFSLIIPSYLKLVIIQLYTYYFFSIFFPYCIQLFLLPQRK